MNKLKLFVWDDFSPDYTSGLAFAIAENQGEAMRMIEKKMGYEIVYWGPCKVHKLGKKAFAVGGGS